MIKITELKIAPQGWRTDTPMVCTVKLSSENATVETVLSESQMDDVLRLVQTIVADAAAKNIADFVAHVRAIDTQNVKVIA